MSNNPTERRNGFNAGIRACIAWLHNEAASMNDPHAKSVLNNAAFHLGQRKPDIGSPMTPPTEPEGWKAAFARFMKSPADFSLTQLEQAFRAGYEAAQAQAPASHPSGEGADLCVRVVGKDGKWHDLATMDGASPETQLAHGRYLTAAIPSPAPDPKLEALIAQTRQQRGWLLGAQGPGTENLIDLLGRLVAELEARR